MLKNIFLTIAVCVFFTVNALESSSLKIAEPEFQLLHLEDTKIEINKITQDNDGFLWFGTNQGLFKYDGYSLEKFLAGFGSISNNIIWDIVEDENNNLWISTYGGGLNKYNPSKNSFQTFIHNNDPNSLSSNTLWDIEKSSSNNLWIGSRHWLNKFNIDKEVNSRLGPKSTPHLKITNRVWTIFEDKNHNLWIGTLGGGLYFYQPQINKLIQYKNNPAQSQSISNNFVRTIIEDKQGNIWVGTDNGLNILDKKTQEFNLHQHSANNINSLSGNEINKLFIDSKDRIWIGTYDAALSLYNKNENNFYRYDFNSLGFHESKTPKNINDISEDRLGTIWFATDKGVVKLTEIASKVHRLKLNNGTSSEVSALEVSTKSGLWFGIDNHLINVSNTFKLKSSLAVQGDITEIAEEPSGDLWIAMLSNGLYKVSPEGKLLLHYTEKKTKLALPCRGITSLLPEKNNRLWLGLTNCNTGGNLALFEESSGVIFRFFPNTPIMSIKRLDANYLLIATNAYGVIKFNINTFQYVFITHTKNENLNQIVDLSISNSGRILLATVGGLAELNIATNEIRLILAEIGNVNWIHELSNNDIWISANSSLMKYNFITKKLKAYDQGDGLNISVYAQRVVTSLKDKLLIGSNSGLIYFDPYSLDLKQPIPKIKLTQLRIFNRPINVSNSTTITPLKMSLSHSSKIELSNEDSLFSISFAALGYRHPEKLIYQYRLEGFNKRWISTDASNRVATFSSLKPGEYTFYVNAIDKQGNKIAKSTSLKINVLPPWWQTNLAYVIYLVLVILLFQMILHFRTKSLKMLTTELEKGVKNRTIELESKNIELKSKNQTITTLLEQNKRMITNISHEFRTPLTLILNPIDNLIKKSKKTKEKSTLKSIKYNSLRLLNMVDQLLELANLQSPNRKSKQLYSVNQILSITVTSFEPLARTKNQILTLRKNQDVILRMLPDSLNIIIANLLSNAIKYTQKGGAIDVSSIVTEDSIILSIKDSGLGIAPKYHSEIFERFNRGSFDNNEQIHGAGIGLTLVKELVELHHGRIEFESLKNIGSNFHVTLPLDHNNYDKSNTTINVSRLYNIPESDTKNLTIPKTIKNNINEVSNLPLLLIIEDNIAMCSYLIDILSSHYNCIYANNGYEALNLIKDQVPDIILCDIMMPKMNGYDLTKAVKQNLALSHIPIILLTAKTDTESRLESWRLYVDDYLTKPFVDEELILKLDKIIAVRAILRKRFCAEMQNNPKGILEIKSELNAKDLTFINKFEELVKVNYKNTDFKRSQVASTLAMSERQLQRKLKSIMDLSFSEYVRCYRLKKASTELQKGLAINLIIETVGFSSPAYFSSCFKAEYGETPKEFQLRSLTLQRDTHLTEK